MAEELNLEEGSESMSMPDLSAFDTSSLTSSVDTKNIDVYKNVVGNPITGSNPQSKLQSFDTSTSADNFENKIRQSASTYDNPYKKMRPYSYNGDYDGANFERYHSTEQYKTLGFSPYRDNESLYNNNMTLGDQFTRAASQWDNLVATGFKSGIKSWGTLFTDPLAPDMESANEMKRAMAIGSSGAGGLGGFAINTFLNSGFSIGIAADFVAEELALAAVTAFTGGLAGEVTVPGMIAKAGLATRRLAGFGEAVAQTAKVLNKGAEIERLAKAGKQGNEALKAMKTGLNTVPEIQTFWNTAGGKFAKGVFDVVNPFDNTIKALQKTDYASNLAKASKTFGGFVDDIIQIKGNVSEAVLEGGMTKLDVTEKLIDKYRADHFGQDPEGEELTKIENLASQEAHRVALYNLPAISVSNKLMYATMIAPISKLIGRGSSTSLNSILFKNPLKGGAADAPFEVLGQGLGARAKASFKSLASPKTYGKFGMDYLKANIAEGVQENIQDAISSGAIDHALSTYSDPSKAAYEGYMGYFMDGLGAQFSAQGAETFAGGLAMGMFAQPVMGSATWTINELSQLTNRSQTAAYKANKEAQDQRDAAALNALYKDDLKFFAPDIKNSIKQQGLAKDFYTAVQNGNEKEARDAQFNALQSHLSTAIRTGKLDIFLDKLGKYKELDPKSALEAFQRYGITTEEDAVKAQGQIDKVIERAEKLRNKSENIGSEFPNPYNYQQYQAGTALHSATVKAYEAWEEAKQNLLYAESSFEDHADRVSKMATTFSNIANQIGQTDAQTFMRLLDPNDTIVELATLQKEIEGLGTVPEQAKLKKDKQKTFDLLSAYHTIVEASQTAETPEIKKQFNKLAKKAFNDYVNHVSKKNKTIVFNKQVDKAYRLILDSHALKNEMQGLAKSINVLNNPKGFLNTQERIYTAFQELDKEKIVTNNQKQFGKVIFNNKLHNDIFKKTGLKIPEDFMDIAKKAAEDGEEFPTPTAFINPKTNELITEGEEFDIALNIWNNFVELVPKNEPKPKKKEPVINKEGEAEYKALSDNLKNDITTLFEQAKKDGEIDENETIGNFIKTNPKAILQIKVTQTQEKLEKLQSEKAETPEPPKADSTKTETKASSGMVEALTQMDYTPDQINKLTGNERIEIIKKGIFAKDFYKNKPATIGTKGTIKVDGKVITMEGVPGSIDFTDNQKDTNFDTMMPEITSLVKNWDKDFVNKNLVNYNGQFIFNYDGRVFVLVQVGKFIVPYYFSSSGTSGKAIDWHYVFGVDENNGWIIKGGVDDKGEMVYSKVFKERYPKTIAELEKIKKEIRTKLAMTTEQRDAVVGQLGTKNKELSKKYNKSLGSIYKDLDVVENRSSSGIEVNDNYNYLVNATLGLIGLDNVKPEEGPTPTDLEAKKADIEKVKQENDSLGKSILQKLGYKNKNRLPNGNVKGGQAGWKIRFNIKNPKTGNSYYDGKGTTTLLNDDYDKRAETLINFLLNYFGSNEKADSKNLQKHYVLEDKDGTRREPFKHLSGGEIGESDFTIYIGSADDVMKFISDIRTKHPEILKLLHAGNKSEDVAIDDIFKGRIEGSKIGFSGYHAPTNLNKVTGSNNFTFNFNQDRVNINYNGNSLSDIRIIVESSDKGYNGVFDKDLKKDFPELYKNIRNIVGFQLYGDYLQGTNNEFLKLTNVDKINAKYDAKLEALEGKSTEPVELKLNVESTTDGLQEFINEDSSINKIEELKLVKKLPEKTKNSFIIDGDILRIKLPTKDFNNRTDGVTYITLKVPENFNQEKFKEELVDIKHPDGRTTADGKSTAKVVEDVRQALQNSITAPVIEETKKAPTTPINDEYIGKIIYMTPGSNKEELAKNNSNVVDVDDLILQTAQDLKPIFKPDLSIEKYKQIGRAYDSVGKKELQDQVVKNMKELASKGMTLITSSVGLMKHADIIMIQQKPELIVKGYDIMSEIEELTNLDKTTIAITDSASNVLQKPSNILLGKAVAEITEEIEPQDITEEYINKNINEKNLSIAKDKGFDAIYKNERYAIVKVNKKTVSLKPIEGNPISVNIADITAVISSEKVPVSEEEIDIFNKNQSNVKKGDITLDETSTDVKDTLNDIINNLCNKK